MATLTIPITVEQIRELTRQLSPQERQALLDSLLAERFDAVLSQSDQRRTAQPHVTDEQIQAEIDAVRRQRREDRQRAAGG
jgi:formate dehydrogenase maturation protein FdhE